MKVKIKILWEKAPGKGVVEVIRGKLDFLIIAGGKGSCRQGSFNFESGTGILEAVISEANIEAGAFPTIVRVRTKTDSFSFFLRDARILKILSGYRNTALPFFRRQTIVPTRRSHGTSKTGKSCRIIQGLRMSLKKLLKRPLQGTGSSMRPPGWEYRGT